VSASNRVIHGAARLGRIRPLVLSLAVVLAHAACGQDDGSDALPPATRLVVAIGEDPGHLNPAITTSGGVHTASEILYNGLVRVAEDLTVHPSLAESWEFFEGGRRVRFHLRPDVRWHDGEPFDADDVVFTLTEVVLRFHSRSRASLGTALRRVVAVDDRTVDLVFDEPYGPLLHQLDRTEAPILPKHLFAGTDPLSHPANREPVGTGPFRFLRYEPGGFRYVANPDYFRGRPRIDEIVWRLVPDVGTQVTALQAGELDWIFSVPGPDRRRLVEDPDIQLAESGRGPGGSNCIMTIGFNLDRALFRDVRARRAVAHAIDRVQFVERVLFGRGRVARAPISSEIAFAHAEGLDLPEHDPVTSRSLLDALGWRLIGPGSRTAHGVTGVADGSPLRFRFAHFPSFSQWAHLLRAQLREVGIDLVLQPMEPAVFVETVFTDRNFDTNIVSYCNGSDPEIGVRRMYVSSNIAPVPFSNGAGYRNEEIDSLFDAARRNLDPHGRGQQYRRIQEIVARDLPYFWLAETQTTRAFRSRCEGFTADGHFASGARCSP
jgi:peptide/nickel transport system substrate-binding protein